MKGTVWFVAFAGALLLVVTMKMRREDEAQISAAYSLIAAQREIIDSYRTQKGYVEAELEARPIQSQLFTVYFPCSRVARPLPRVVPVFSRDSQVYAAH